ncbi:MAG: inner membrane CreD family protein, partial [Bdellovibrionaceae bacterium]|nr:inner membrane CreD family protein [Pseudobdellovibrionaceae bacterium]
GASAQAFGESSLFIPTTEKEGYDPKSKIYSYKDNSFSFLPTHRDINITTTHEYRKRGIFKIPIITTKTLMINTFDVTDMNRRIKNLDNSVAKNKSIDLNIAHSSPNTITDFQIEIDGVKVPAKRSSTGIVITLDPVFLQKEKMIVTTHFTSKTYNELTLKVPQGENKITMSSTWPHPSFEGQLPQEHTTTNNGFKASWSLFEPSPEQVLTVRFIEPVNIYSLNTRSLKYAVLIIVLSLSLFFLFEILFQLQLHAMHYMLLSLPLSVFFILLVALSEHITFDASYITASVATVALMTIYLIGIGAVKKLASLFSIYLSMVYGVIYTLLNSEDYALLLGAVSIFLALAVFMLLTRKVNWRKLKIENATTHA